MFSNLKWFKIKIKFQFKDKTQDFLKIKPMKRTAIVDAFRHYLDDSSGCGKKSKF